MQPSRVLLPSLAAADPSAASVDESVVAESPERGGGGGGASASASSRVLHGADGTAACAAEDDLADEEFRVWTSEPQAQRAARASASASSARRQKQAALSRARSASPETATAGMSGLFDVQVRDLPPGPNANAPQLIDQPA